MLLAEFVRQILLEATLVEILTGAMTASGLKKWFVTELIPQLKFLSQSQLDVFRVHVDEVLERGGDWMIEGRLKDADLAVFELVMRCRAHYLLKLFAQKYGLALKSITTGTNNVGSGDPGVAIGDFVGADGERYEDMDIAYASVNPIDIAKYDRNIGFDVLIKDPAATGGCELVHYSQQQFIDLIRTGHSLDMNVL